MSHLSSTARVVPPGGARPLGVWILTIWDGLFAGLLPAGAALLIYCNPADALLGMSVIDLAWSILLGTSVLVAAIRAWQGNTAARIALVALVTLHYGLLALNNLLLATSSILPETKQMTAWARVFRSVVWIGVNAWYFLGSRPSQFYQRAQADRRETSRHKARVEERHSRAKPSFNPQTGE